MGLPAQLDNDQIAFLVAQARPAGLHPIFQAALQATLCMGFVEADALCLAYAWLRQYQRKADPTDWPDQPADFGLSTQLNPDSGFAPCPHRLGLYAVLPDARWVARMAAAGVPTLQLRFKSDDPTAIDREVRASVQAVAGTGAMLFINDHWQAALDAGAYGVHLGQEDLATAPLQMLRASGIRLGLSTHGYAEMLRADTIEPSYIAMGAVFATTLKRMTTAPQGLGRLYAYAQLLQHYPLVAIGGIDAATIPAVLQSGVGSVAVVRALVGADQPETAAQLLMKQMAAPQAEQPTQSQS
jgi:thiamine-phosphate pyrophosphorylase